MKYYYVKRLSDGKVMDIPEKHLEETLRQGFEVIGEAGALYNNSTVEPPKPENKYECPICGFVAKNESGLRLHKRRHYDK